MLMNLFLLHAFCRVSRTENKQVMCQDSIGRTGSIYFQIEDLELSHSFIQNSTLKLRLKI